WTSTSPLTCGPCSTATPSGRPHDPARQAQRRQAQGSPPQVGGGPPRPRQGIAAPRGRGPPQEGRGGQEVSEIKPFTFPATGAAVRVVTVDGDPWFVAADVCAVLAIRNNRD